MIIMTMMMMMTQQASCYNIDSNYHQYCTDVFIFSFQTILGLQQQQPCMAQQTTRDQLSLRMPRHTSHYCSHDSFTSDTMYTCQSFKVQTVDFKLSTFGPESFGQSVVLSRVIELIRNKLDASVCTLSKLS